MDGADWEGHCVVLVVVVVICSDRELFRERRSVIEACRVIKGFEFRVT